MSRFVPAFAAVIVCFCSQAWAADVACQPKFDHGRAEVALPMHPYMAVQLRNTCAVLVSLSDNGEPAKGGIAVLGIVDGRFTVAGLLNLPSEAVGMAVTADESVVAVAGTARVYFLDLPSLLAGKADAVLGSAEYDPKANTVSVALTPDERFLFASDEGASTVSVIDFAAARAARFANAPVLGRVPVDYAPTVLVVTPDGRNILVPVQGIRRKFNPPIICPGEGDPNGPAVNQSGGIVVIGVRAANTNPDSATLSRALAGCSPVRIVLTDRGRTALVTNRNGDMLRIMDVGRILDGEGNATVAMLRVGPTPIGVAVVEGERLALVSNSHRWVKDEKPRNISVIDISRRHKPVSLGTIPVGVFPRDIAVSRDGRNVFVSNFGSKSLTVLDGTRLRAMARRRD